MGKIWEKVKGIFKPEVEKVESELGQNADHVKDGIVSILDKNGDGKLSIDDFYTLVKVVLDTDGDGKVEFWEIITALFLVRRELKKVKG